MRQELNHHQWWCKMQSRNRVPQKLHNCNLAFILIQASCCGHVRLDPALDGKASSSQSCRPHLVNLVLALTADVPVPCHHQ